MHAAIGVSLIALAAWAFNAVRPRNGKPAKGWVRTEFGSMVFIVAVMTLVVTGVALIAESFT
ncbi:MAG: hypothetical protein JNK11_04745 [Alphaproteobacteria bacterium]|nr:hypothetical protein [Alphaproteobacteria bacterium]